VNLTIEAVWDHHSRAVREEEGPKPTAAGTLNRVSDTGSCLRSRGFDAAGIAESEMIDPGTLLAFGIGDHIHGSLQAAIARCWPESRIEEPIDLSDLGVSLSGHTDGIIEMSGVGRVVVEIKTAGAYAASLAWRNGPKAEHVAQAALYAMGENVNADAVLLVYVAKEKSRPSKALPGGINPGDMREWLLPLDDPSEFHDGATPREMGELEIGWFAQVEQSIVEGFLPRAEAPDDEGGLQFIEYPVAYGVQHPSGTYWGCRYCRHNSTCVAVGPNPVGLDIVREARG
jgi:hypothetical protein